MGRKETMQLGVDSPFVNFSAVSDHCTLTMCNNHAVSAKCMYYVSHTLTIH